MSRIHTNVPAIRAIVQIGRNQREIELHLERLSTGLKINRGADDPAGLIVSQRLRSEMTGLAQAIANSRRTINVVSVAEAALGEINVLLDEMKGLIVNTGNDGAINQAEIDANQLQVDSIIESIKRIANTTEFAGRKLLDGNLAYLVSGKTTSQISDIRIFASRLPDSGGLTISVTVTQSAQQAQLAHNQGDATPLSTNVTIEVAGNFGTEVLSFTCGTALSVVAAGINNFTDLTGVMATLSGTSAVLLDSVGFGSSQFVSVRTIAGNFIDSAGIQSKDAGQDVGAVINGQSAGADGLEVSVRTQAIDFELIFTSGFAQQTTSGSSFVITEGGAVFQISPFINTNGQVHLGIPTIMPTNLGNSVIGILEDVRTGNQFELDLDTVGTAENIVNEAINQISTLRARLGAFQINLVETNINSMQVALENVTAAESGIRDADMAEEISKLTSSQILLQASIRMLTIANQIPSNVLQLLG